MTYQRILSEEDRKKSLQDLDERDLGDGTYFPSHVVLTCHALRRKPLCEFNIEDLRLMIAQRQSLEYLIPLAIERLEQKPLVAGTSIRAISSPASCAYQAVFGTITRTGGRWFRRSWLASILSHASCVKEYRRFGKAADKSLFLRAGQASQRLLVDKCSSSR